MPKNVASIHFKVTQNLFWLCELATDGSTEQSDVLIVRNMNERCWDTFRFLKVIENKNVSGKIAQARDIWSHSFTQLAHH